MSRNVVNVAAGSLIYSFLIFGSAFETSMATACAIFDFGKSE
jgi:hypothetical protein